MLRTALAGLVLLAALATPALGQADNGQDVPSRTFEFTYSTEIPAPASGTRVLEIWVPLPMEDPGVQEVHQLSDTGRFFTLGLGITGRRLPANMKRHSAHAVEASLAARPYPSRSRSCTAARSTASSLGLKTGLPARCPQRESIRRSSALGIFSVSRALSSGVK